MSDQKTFLRDQARKHRILNDVSHEDVEAVIPLFFDTIQTTPGQVLAAYWPKGREFDPTGILEEAHNRGLSCALPKVVKDTNVLDFIEWVPETTMQSGAFGIMEPQTGKNLEPDIFIIPMLAFDRQGYRLGQGGGYYDATLAHYRAKKEIIAVGIGYASQAVLFNLPRESHDQRMDYILTPNGMTNYKD